MPRCRQVFTHSFGRLQLAQAPVRRLQGLAVTRAEAEAPARPQQPARPSTGSRGGGGGRSGTGGSGGRPYQGRGGSGGRGGGRTSSGQFQGQRPPFQQQSGSQGRGGFQGRGRGRDQPRNRGAAEGFVINDEIRFPEVRLLGEEKEQLGVVSLDEALDRAEEADVDLVLISPDARPPVARLIEVSKLKFQQEKARKEAAAKSRAARQDLKELKMRPSTEEHDYQVRLRSAVKFLAKGDKVKLTVQFKGREMQHVDVGRELFHRFVADLEKADLPDVVVESQPRMQGRQMMMIVGKKGDNN